MGKRKDSRASDRHRKQEARLDEALAESFPASDPIAAGEPTGIEPLSTPVDRKPPTLDVTAVQQRRRRGLRR
jgi:hypothetical protein